MACENGEKASFNSSKSFLLILLISSHISAYSIAPIMAGQKNCFGTASS